MKALFSLLAIAFPLGVFGHPGGGIVALSEDSALVADPTENFIWLVKEGEEPKKVVSKFHGHWMTRGRDGRVYTEAFQERGGAWPSAAFQIDPQTGKLTEVADHGVLGILEFGVDGDGSLVFQRGSGLVSRLNGKETEFRPHAESLRLGKVTAYTWNGEGDLILSDENQIHLIKPEGATKRIAEIVGKVIEPRIWNGTDVPRVFGLAVEKSGNVLATVPHLAKVYRIRKNGSGYERPEELICNDGNWRATGVSVFGESIFLMESDARASTSPRVRILRVDVTSKVLNLPHPER